MLVLVTRPHEQAAATAQALEALGHQVLIDPVLTIRPLPRPALPTERVAAVAITSANAAPALAWTNSAVPVFAVGGATAIAAHTAGRMAVHVASGDGQTLAALIKGRIGPAAGVILHLSGADVREGLEANLVAAGYRYRRAVVYEAVPADRLATVASAAIADRRLGAALFYSPRSAAVWARLITRQGLADHLAATLAVCLSDAVAAPLAQLAFKEIRVADAREQNAVLRCLAGTA